MSMSQSHEGESGDPKLPNMNLEMGGGFDDLGTGVCPDLTQEGDRHMTASEQQQVSSRKSVSCMSSCFMCGMVSLYNPGKSKAGHVHEERSQVEEFPYWCH